MKNGTEIKYYSGSKKFKKSETSYKNGKKHGKDTYWRRPGMKMYEHTYKNGKLDGPCIDYDKHGNIIEKYSYTKGDRDISYTDYYETIIDSPDPDYYEAKAGKRKSQMRQLKDGSASYFEWYENGNKKAKGKYNKEGLKTGIWSEWYGDGSKRSEGKFKNGDAIVERYSFDGRFECAETYVKNLKDGKWVGYGFEPNVHENFMRSENVVKVLEGNLTAYIKYIRHYNNGIKTGKWFEYLLPGIKASEGYYKNNKKDGLWSYYLMDFIYGEDLDQGIYEEKVGSRGNYVNGKKHGVWYHEDPPFENYGERGEPVSSLYDHGKFVKEVPLIDDQDRPF